METYANVDMQDYWNEYRTVHVRIAELRGSNSEEDNRSHDDDSDDTFLEAVLPDRLKEDREISEAELTNSRLYFTLTERQKAQLIRRTQERNLTLRQKRLKVKSQKPDLWSVFSGTDNSSTGTRSRSATPDSLDSISPPRTPPESGQKNWVDSHLSRSRASLDSGHHSLIMSPTSSLSPTSPTSSSPHHLDSPVDAPPPPRKPDSRGGKRELSRRYSPPDGQNSYYFPPEGREGNRIYRPSSVDILSENKPPRSDVSRATKEATVRRQRSYAKDLPKDVRQHYGNKGQYEFHPRLYYDPEGPDIQGLHYKQIGSLHGPHSKTKDKRGPLDQTILPQDTQLRRTTSNGVRRTQSIKHYPRDPFDHENDRENIPKSESPSRPKFESDVYENPVRSKNATDLGFRVVPSQQEEEFPDLVLEVGRSGKTLIDWLHEEDLTKLRSLSLLELDILFSEHNIHHSWRKRNKRRKVKEAENGVFGVMLETLHEKDNDFLLNDASCMESQVPQVLHKLITHLELRGLRDEGILRIPGHRARTEELRRCLDESFYSSPHLVDAALRNASPNEIAALVKLFLRELPHPLLPQPLSLAFYKTHKISNLGERVLALTMLTILLPTVYRDTLKAVLDLCGRIVAHESENKMGLYNVAMIIAPNIFLPSFQPKARLLIRSDDKEHQLNSEMEYARVTTQLVQALIKYREVLWTVPNRLIAQIRHQYESSLKTSNSKPIHKFLSRRPKDLIQRPILNEIDYQNGVLRISSPQFNKLSYPIHLDWTMTAKDILASFIEEQTSSYSNENPHRVTGRREQKQTTKQSYHHSTSASAATAALVQAFHSYPPPASNASALTTCLLRGSIKHALENHALHERGGNITEKRIDHEAYLIAVYQDNPNGEFLVKCHHPGGTNDLN